MNRNQIVQTIPVNFEPTSAAMSTDLKKVAIGCQKSKVVVYDIIQGGRLKESGCTISTNGDVTDVKFSPDNKHLGISTGKKQVKVVACSGNFDVEKLDQSS